MKASLRLMSSPRTRAGLVSARLAVYGEGGRSSVGAHASLGSAVLMLLQVIMQACACQTAAAPLAAASTCHANHSMRHQVRPPRPPAMYAGAACMANPMPAPYSSRPAMTVGRPGAKATISEAVPAEAGSGKWAS